MATQPTHPFQNSSAAAANNGAGPMTPARMALDNLLRRELKVSDPNDSKLVAEALLTRYKDSPRAIAIQREAQGVPFLTAPTTPITVSAAATSSDAELLQAVDDVNRDLQELTTNTILKDVSSELQGWALAIRSAITEGTNAARFALEARQKDKAFAIRRQLGDYARMARLVGTLTPGVSQYYRKLAQSLDEVASVLLVKMGEALAGVGFSGGRFLLQVPYTELQVRRDAVIYALHNLTGATQTAYGQNDWPRGLDAYRQLFDLLEMSGQSDLRSLLLEHELSRIMDELIQRAAHGSADGLRALGATAHLDLERFRRLIFIGRRDVDPESPPLTSFLLALQLFADAFEGGGGFRLMRIARPPILFYGLYGIGGMAKADQRLLQLVIERGLLAEKLDCFMQCCGTNLIRTQIILDKLLYDLDRAIDLYAVGTDELGEPEARASAYSSLIETFLNDAFDIDPNLPEDARDLDIFPTANLVQIQDLLKPSSDQNLARRFWEMNLQEFNARLEGVKVREQELCVQKQMESRWKQLLQTMAPNCTSLEVILKVIDDLISQTIRAVGGDPTKCNVTIALPPTQETSWHSLTHRVPSSGRQ